MTFPARNVIPKPYQKPHPPLWVACSNIRTIGEAGQWGMGALGFSFVSPEAARAWVHKYYNMLLHQPQATDGVCNQPERRDRQWLHVCADGRRGTGESRRLDVFHFRLVVLWSQRRRCSRQR